MEKAIVLLSGGAGSAVAAAMTARSNQVCAVFVNYHQRAAGPEMKAYDKLCDHFNVVHYWRPELTHLKQVGGSAVVDPVRKLEEVGVGAGGVPATFVAGLMPALLDVAVSFAVRIGATSVVTGLSEAGPEAGSTSPHPDHRQEFIHNYQYMIDSALPQRSRVRIEAPLVDLTREEIVQLGVRFKVPFELTWSCYDGGEQPCGRCLGCVRRTAGFMGAGVVDPLAATEVGAAGGRGE